MINHHSKGIIITLVLVFGSLFLLMLAGLLGFISLEHRQSLKKVAWSEALEIAEAGINYARWHLSHSPSDFNFSGTYDYKDPEGTKIGKYQLEITPPSGCDSAVIVKSTGWTLKFPEVKRKIRVKYAKPSLAKYAFLTNSNVWFGPEEELKGPFHSNGGIRMDGKQNSLSTSAKETYICGPEHGCSPPQEKPGIWGEGEGGKEGLWQFPVSNIDFASITRDLAILKEEAQSSGIYLGSLGLGYHIKFKSNGTFDVYRVKKLKPKVWGYDGENRVYESNDIEDEEFYQNYPLPGNCAPIFVEDNLWVDGEVKGRVTLVAAKLPETAARNAKIIISGNINYVDGNSVLGLIGQKDILIPLYSPDRLEIKAALLAQKGHVFRYYYYPKWPWEPYKTYTIRSYIETFGSIITNTIWTFSWVDSAGNVVSGYKETEMSYDPNLTYNPPPYFPVSGEYEIVAWEEI